MVLANMGEAKSEAEVAEIMKGIDVDGGGEVSQEEFTHWWEEVSAAAPAACIACAVRCWLAALLAARLLACPWVWWT